jgi:hypothetical protein
MFPSSDNVPRAFSARTTGSGAHVSLMGATVRLSQMKDARKADPVDARAPRWICDRENSRYRFDVTAKPSSLTGSIGIDDRAA